MMLPSSSSTALRPAQRQPRTIRLSIKYLLSLPDRLCNPPPAVGKVRSCGVTPLFKIRLEDVLNRKHLPPLGLKDFEEWLLFVENAPENLYFVLWLREYTRRYNEWAVRAKAKSANRTASPTFSVDSEDSDCPVPFAAFEYHVSPGPADPCPSLALFYHRAKQTFLTPGAPYELNVASDVLAPFHTTPTSPASPHGFGCFSPHPSQQSSYTYSHPDPAIFADLNQITMTALRASLDRFVLAAYSNVGTNRGLCGLVGGCTIATAGSLPIWVASFVEGWVRWMRFAALPGLWLGLTIVIASLHGVCMMIYVFGDFRQLRKFELSRPSISKPQPHPEHPVIATNYPHRLTSLKSRLSVGQLSIGPVSPKSPKSPTLSFTSEKSGRTRAIRDLLALRPKQQEVEELRVTPPQPITRPPATILPRRTKVNGGVMVTDSLKEAQPKLRVQIPFPAVAPLPPQPAIIISEAREVELSRPSTSSGSSCISGMTGVHEVGYPRIHVSEAFDDPNPPAEGPATATYCPETELAARERALSESQDEHAEDWEANGKTADFIQAWELESDWDDMADMEKGRLSGLWDSDGSGLGMGVERGMRWGKGGSGGKEDVFDFDGLPPRRARHPYAYSLPLSDAAERDLMRTPGAEEKRARKKDVVSVQKEVVGKTGKWWTLMARLQEWCIGRTGVVKSREDAKKRKDAEEKRAGMDSPFSFSAPLAPLNFPAQSVSKRTTPSSLFGFQSTTPSSPASTRPLNPQVRLQYQRKVPAFGSPLTKIWSPVVTRAQWEIVVRSAAIAAALAWILVGVVVAIPDGR